METSFFVLIFILILTFISYFRHFQMRKRYPPGPWSFPFVGLLPFRVLQIVFSRFLPNLSQAKYFRDMKEKYGDIWSLDFGRHRIIVLASYDIITEAFIDNGKSFSGRPVNDVCKLISENRGILLTDGEVCQGNRSLAIRVLRDLGMGKQVLESKICPEVEKLIENIENSLLTPKGSPFIFWKPVSNVISQLAFSNRNKYNDLNFESFIKNINLIVHSKGGRDLLDLFTNILPMKYTRKIFPEVDQYINSTKGSLQFIVDKCKSRMKIEGEYSKPSCAFDYFWRYRYQDQPEIDPEEKFLDISHSMFDIFMAGTDTTISFLGFSFLVLGHDEDVQEELRKEIQILTDDYKLINMEMRKECPKLLSFIDEIQRYFSIIPILPRRTVHSCIFRGYRFEPHDVVYGDMCTIMRDPTIFENPDVFDAYRFMDESRTKYIPNKCLITFGMGKRACIGESIAVMEIFLFLSKIIQRFKFSLTNEAKMNYYTILEGDSSFAHTPLDHEIIFQLVQ